MAKVELIGLYGLEQSVMGSKFPMSTEIESLTNWTFSTDLII